MSDETGWFIDVTALPDDIHGFFQVLFLGAMYGYGLMYAATLISDGSELLLLIPKIAGLVGSIVLPVLGAVPDGMIVFFSGMGPDAQKELSVGVGALAGSTSMLLTIPWFLSIVGGRVAVDSSTGKCNYSNKTVPPLSDISRWGQSGVKLTSDVHKGAYVMIISSFSYLLLQVPGLWYEGDSLQQVAFEEHSWALVGFFCCLFLFCAYMWYSWQISEEAESSHNAHLLTRDEKIKESIVSGDISLLGAMHSEFEFSGGGDQTYDNTHKYGAVSTTNSSEHAFLRQRVTRLVKPFFFKYDDDKSGSLELEELGRVFMDLGERLSTTALKERFQKFDVDKDGHVDFDEFVTGVIEYLTDHSTHHKLKFIGRVDSGENRGMSPTNVDDSADAGSDDEHEEIPEDIQSLPPDQQQSAIINRAVLQMGMGTILVLLLSDPTVDVLNEIGVRLEINPFYVAFVLAPLASNASEVIASYSYSTKKTVTSMTVALSALEGAAIMNNTFVFGIFTLLVYTQGLAWEYFAETLSILIVQVLIGVMALKKTHTLIDAFLVLLIFPLSLVFVALLESIGWD